MQNFLSRLKIRIMPFFDLTAWVLLLVCVVPLVLIDPIMVKTLIQWNAFFLAFAAITIVISRIAFSQIDLTWWVEKAKNGDLPAAVVVFSIAWFMSITMLALVLWAKS